MIKEIGDHLLEEKVFSVEQSSMVLGLSPSDAFVNEVNNLLSIFKIKRNHDKFMQHFYSVTRKNWEEYFPSQDQKIVFLMLIHLPERLVKVTLTGKEVFEVRKCHNFIRLTSWLFSIYLESLTHQTIIPKSMC